MVIIRSDQATDQCVGRGMIVVEIGSSTRKTVFERDRLSIFW